MSIADCWPMKAPAASPWKIAISIPASSPAPANTAWPTTLTPSSRAQLAEKDAASIDPALLRNVLDFYRDLQLPYATKKSPKTGPKLSPPSANYRLRVANHRTE